MLIGRFLRQIEASHFNGGRTNIDKTFEFIRSNEAFDRAEPRGTDHSIFTEIEVPNTVLSDFDRAVCNRNVFRHNIFISDLETDAGKSSGERAFAHINRAVGFLRGQSISGKRAFAIDNDGTRRDGKVSDGNGALFNGETFIRCVGLINNHRTKFLIAAERKAPDSAI